MVPRGLCGWEFEPPRALLREGLATSSATKCSGIACFKNSGCTPVENHCTKQLPLDLSLCEMVYNEESPKCNQ